MGRETKSTRSVEGTHWSSPPAWIIVIWSLLTLFNPLLREVLGHLWLSTLVGAVMAVALLILGRRWIPRTQVSPEGLRIRRAWHEQELWAEVQAVEWKGRWDITDVCVRLRDGSSVPLPGMPADWWAKELEAYWHARRSTSGE